MGKGKKPCQSLCWVFLWTPLLSGCGYSLQGGRSQELEKEGIHRVYVTTIRNDTYKPGVENVVYNALVRSLASHRGIELVSRPEDADAILSGAVTQAESQVSASTTVPSLNPSTLGSQITTILPAYTNIPTATLYNAVLTATFNLNRRNPTPKQKGLLWSGTFNRSQIFAASNQLGSLGTTSMLINSSEFDRVVAQVSKSMMSDVREAMLARF